MLIVISIGKKIYKRLRNRRETTDDLNIICKAVYDGLPFSSKGHWVAEKDEGMNLIGYHCSICNFPLEFLKKYNYCPNCGIRMFES